jgi:hypothetical protein
MPIRHKAIALFAILPFLIVACGQAEPTATPVPPTLLPTLTPAPLATRVLPTAAPVAAPETPIPPTLPIPTEAPTAPAATPGPSPAGLIVFYSERDGNAEIYVMNPAPLEGGTSGSNQRRLTNNETNEFAPTWSPDGRQIL